MKKILFSFILVFGQASAWGLTLHGTAKNADGQVAYLEKIEVKKDSAGLNQFIRVEYTKPDGSIFATMTSDFAKDKNIPDTIFEDFRFGVKYTLQLTNGEIQVEESKKGKSVARKTFPVKGVMVASQGFDNFIRTNAEKLTTEPVDFRFGVLAKKDFYSLTAFQKPSDSKAEFRFGIRAQNWFIRLFADEIVAVYDAKTFHLKEFKGISNIPDDKEHTQKVTISYSWEK